MAEAYYEPTPATDGATMNPVPGAVFQVFEIADTAFATPLSLRVGSGNPTTTVTASDTLATLPGVYVTSPNYEHIWKSGTFEWRRDSIDGAKKAIEDAKVSAQDAAGSSGEAAQAAANSAASAADSAAAASDAAALVGAPADTVMRDIAANPSSGFTQQQDANYARVRRVEPGEDLAGALAAGGRVRLVGTHVITAQLTIPSNTHFDADPGAVLDVSGMADGFPSVVIAGSSAAAVTLAGDAAEGASTVTVTSATGIVAGDYVKVSSSQSFGFTGQPRGEIVRVASVSTNTLTLEDPLCDTYPVASSGQVEKLTFAENIVIEGIRWVGGSDITKNTIGIDVKLARNLTMKRCSSKNVHTAVAYFTDVIQSSVSDCHFVDCRRAGFGYGLAFLYACQDITVTNCTGTKLRHLVTAGGGTGRRGIVRRLAVSNCTASQADSSGFDCHPSAEFVSFVGCHVIGSANDGFTMQAGRFVIANCTVEGATGYGILVQNLTIRGLDGVIANNVIHRTPGRGIAAVIDTTAAYMRWSGLSITGNVISDSGMGITCENSSTNYVEGLVVSGNTVRRCTSSRVAILRGTQGAVVQGNNLHGPGGGLEVLRLFTALNTLVSGNHIDGGGAGNGINIITSTGVVINGNQIRNSTGIGVIGDVGSTDGIYGDNRNSYTTKESIAGAGWAKANNL